MMIWKFFINYFFILHHFPFLIIVFSSSSSASSFSDGQHDGNVELPVDRLKSLFLSVADTMPESPAKFKHALGQLRRILFPILDDDQENINHCIKKMSQALSIPHSPSTNMDASSWVQVLREYLDILGNRFAKVKELSLGFSMIILDARSKKPSKPSSIRFLHDIVPYCARLYHYHRDLGTLLMEFDKDIIIQSFVIPDFLTDSTYTNGWSIDDSSVLENINVDALIKRLVPSFDLETSIGDLTELVTKFEKYLDSMDEETKNESLRFIQEQLSKYSLDSSSNLFNDFVHLISLILKPAYFDREFAIVTFEEQISLSDFESFLSEANLCIGENYRDMVQGMLVDYLRQSKPCRQRQEMAKYMLEKLIAPLLTPIFSKIPYEMQEFSTKEDDFMHAFLDLLSTVEIRTIFPSSSKEPGPLAQYVESYLILRGYTSSNYWLDCYKPKALLQAFLTIDEELYQNIREKKSLNYRSMAPIIAIAKDITEFMYPEVIKNEHSIIYFTNHLFKAFKVANRGNFKEFSKSIYRKLHPFFGEWILCYLKRQYTFKHPVFIPPGLIVDSLEIIEAFERNPKNNPPPHCGVTRENLESLLDILPPKFFKNRDSFGDRFIMKRSGNGPILHVIGDLFFHRVPLDIKAIPKLINDPKKNAQIGLFLTIILLDSHLLESCCNYDWEFMAQITKSIYYEQRINLCDNIDELYKGYHKHVKAIEGLIMEMLDHPDTIQRTPETEMRSPNIITIACLLIANNSTENSGPVQSCYCLLVRLIIEDALNGGISRFSYEFLRYFKFLKFKSSPKSIRRDLLFVKTIMAFIQKVPSLGLIYQKKFSATINEIKFRLDRLFFEHKDLPPLIGNFLLKLAMICGKVFYEALSSVMNWMAIQNNTKTNASEHLQLLDHIIGIIIRSLTLIDNYGYRQQIIHSPDRLLLKFIKPLLDEENIPDCDDELIDIIWDNLLLLRSFMETNGISYNIVFLTGSKETFIDESRKSPY